MNQHLYNLKNKNHNSDSNMRKSFLIVRSRQFYRWIQNVISNEYIENDLKRKTIVFSPHFDDETLGCGGTIIKKKKAGADVKIVFMTDGSKSHTGLILENHLKTIRSSEGLAASRSLGLKDCDVFFLGFEETKLMEHLKSASDKVKEILLHHQPEEIFIPYGKDFLPDHVATNRIVKFALKSSKLKPTIYEYPVWFWHQLPWTNPFGTIRIGRKRKILLNTIVSGLGLLLLKDFRCFVYIKDVIELKQAALDKHRSQMTQLIPESGWKTLYDVSNGEFLECFFQKHEIFYRYNFNSKSEN